MQSGIKGSMSVLCGLGELCVKIPVQDPTPSKIQGSLAAKERKERKEQTLYFYAFSAIFRG